jgi:hypothetical protein
LLPVLLVVLIQPRNEDTTILNSTDKIIKHKTDLLNLAEELAPDPEELHLAGKLLPAW